MVNRAYDYQYDTNPRKLKPYYNDRPKKQVKKKKSTVLKNKTSKVIPSKKSKRLEELTFKVKVSALVLIAFAMLFIVIYRNSQINEAFSKIQKLKAQATEIQKENDQLKIGIQNSENTNNLEKAAKDLLGMQKLSNKQTRYITLPKKDYVEPTVEEIIIEEEQGFFSNIISKIKNTF